MRATSIVLCVTVVSIGCSSSDAGSAGDDASAPNDSSAIDSATSDAGTDAHDASTTDAPGDAMADANADANADAMADAMADAKSEGDASDAPIACTPPTTTWVQQTTESIGADAKAHIAFDCDSVFTLTPNGSARGYVLQSWKQSDGSPGWKTNVVDGADAVGSALVRAADGLYFVVGESANLEKHDAKTGALIWQKTDPNVHAFCKVAATDGALFTTTEMTKTGSSAYEYRVEKRSLVDGSIVWSVVDADEIFCNGGTIGHMDGLVATKDGVFTAGYKITRRSLVDGSLVYASDKSGDAVAFSVGDAHYYVAGSSAGAASGFFSGWDLAQYDVATGKLGWEQKWNSNMTGNGGAGMTTFGDGALFVGGIDRTMSFSPYDTQWDVERIDPSTGHVTWTQTYDPGSSSQPTDGATDGASVYFVGVGDGDALRVEKRKVADGKI